MWKFKPDVSFLGHESWRWIRRRTDVRPFPTSMATASAQRTTGGATRTTTNTERAQAAKSKWAAIEHFCHKHSIPFFFFFGVTIISVSLISNCFFETRAQRLFWSHLESGNNGGKLLSIHLLAEKTDFFPRMLHKLVTHPSKYSSLT